MNIVFRQTIRHPISAILGVISGLLELAGSIQTRSAIFDLAPHSGTACDWFDAVVDSQFRQSSLLDYVRDQLAIWKEWSE